MPSDPLPFSWMAHHPELCDNTKFIDVDFTALMESKREIIFNTPQMKDMLSATTDLEQEEGVVFDSAEYAGIGCDLRNLRRLKRLITAVAEIDQCLVLCVSEVSITYMNTDDADALIRWTTTLSPGEGRSVCSPELIIDGFRHNVLSIGAAISRSSGQSIYCYYAKALCQTWYTAQIRASVPGKSCADDPLPGRRIQSRRDSEFVGALV